jgi:hypothetical protein
MDYFLCWFAPIVKRGIRFDHPVNGPILGRSRL